MWYEILPSAGLVFAFLTIPTGANWCLNKLFHNRKHCARDWLAGRFEDYEMYRRDWRIANTEYKPKGLETIPDPPSPPN